VDQYALLSSASSGVLVGLGVVLTRALTGDLGPASLALFRYAIAIWFILPWFWHRGRPSIRRTDLAPLALVGIGQFAVLTTLLNLSLEFISAGTAALLFALFPALALLIAARVYRERIDPALIIGLALTLLGVGVIVGGSASLSRISMNEVLGDSAALSSALVGAFCSVLVRPFLRRSNVQSVGWFTMLCALPVLTILGVSEGGLSAASRISEVSWTLVLLLGVSSGVGYILWLWALHHASATRVAQFLALSPLTAGVLGAMFLGEPLGPPFIIALGFVVAGLLISHNFRPGKGGFGHGTTARG